MASHCRAMLIEVTSYLASGELDVPLMAVDPTDAESLLDVLTAPIEPGLRDLALDEFDELPPAFVPSLVLAWRDAHAARIPFTVESRAPERGIEAAKAGRVTWTVEADEDGVRMYVSHWDGHHAEWMNAPDRVLERRNMASISPRHAYTTPD